MTRQSSHQQPNIRRGIENEYIYIVNKLNLRKTLHERNEKIKQRFNEQIHKQHITTTHNRLVYIPSTELNSTQDSISIPDLELNDLTNNDHSTTNTPYNPYKHISTETNKQQNKDPYKRTYKRKHKNTSTLIQNDSTQNNLNKNIITQSNDSIQNNDPINTFNKDPTNIDPEQHKILNKIKKHSSRKTCNETKINKQDEINLRNELIYNIAFAPRDMGNGERFTEIEKAILKKYYPNYINKNNDNNLTFSQSFFNANIDDLIFIAQLLKMMPPYNI